MVSVELVAGAGVPEAAPTFTVKGLILAHCEPVVTWMVIAAVVPTFAAAGVPVTVPCTVLKPIHEGLLAIWKDTLLPFVPVTVGVKV